MSANHLKKGGNENQQGEQKLLDSNSFDEKVAENNNNFLDNESNQSLEVGIEPTQDENTTENNSAAPSSTIIYCEHSEAEGSE